MASSLCFQKVEARVFATPSSTQGGNPLTIYMFPNVEKGLDEQQVDMIHSDLARKCPWESVMIHNQQQGTLLPEIFFYLPSGQAIAYCAHAAMGACAYLGRSKGLDQGIIQFKLGRDSLQGESQVESAMVESNNVTLYIKSNGVEMDANMIVVENLLHLQQDR